MGGKVLIIDDVATNRIVMKVKLTAAGYLPEVAADGASCLAMARATPPDLILLDYALPDMTGTEVLRQLRADPATQRVPVVMFSASQSADTRIEAFRAGADDFLVKPIDDQTLLARIRSLRRAHETVAGFETGMPSGFGAAQAMADLGFGLARPVPAGPALAQDIGTTQPSGMAQPHGMAEPPAAFLPPSTVALILHRPEVALFLRRNLSSRIAGRIITMTAEEALASALTDAPAPDLYVIEDDLPLQGGGLRLMSDLLSRSASRHASFAIYRSADSTASAAMAFDLGADEILHADTVPMEITLRLQRLLALKHAADRQRASVQDGLRLAVIDPLTGLHNRRYGLAQMQAIAQNARATGSGFAVMVVDIDQFKSVNDRFGHSAGDAVLVQVAARLRANLRAGDLLARIGGEEFLIALPNMAPADLAQANQALSNPTLSNLAPPDLAPPDLSLPEARAIAERLCTAMAAQPFDLGHGQFLSVTISIGLAISEDGDRPAHLETVTDIVDRADRALMRSKAAGRNQVTIGRSAA